MSLVAYSDGVWWQWHSTDTRHALFVTRLFACIMVATEISIPCVSHNSSSSVNIIHRHFSFFISYRWPFSCLSLFFIVRAVYWCMAAIYKHIMRPFFPPFFLLLLLFLYFHVQPAILKKNRSLFLFLYSCSPLNFCPYNYYISNASISCFCH